MFRNYLIVALRNLIRYRLYSVITIAGLAVGLACVMFIALYVRDELSYDKWLTGTKNLYQVEVSFQLPGRPRQDFGTVSFPIPAALHDLIPEVTAYTRLATEQMTVIVDDRQFSETVQVVDPNFFRLIKLPFVSGNPAQVLSLPESVVLTETMARKYFGDVNPVGRMLTVNKGNCNLTDQACFNGTIPLIVTGVIKDLPHNTQLPAAVFLPNTSSADQYDQEEKQEWTSTNNYAYVELAPGTRPQTVLDKFAPIVDRELTEKIRQAGFHVPGSQVLLVHLTPFLAVHLGSAHFLPPYLTPPGDWTIIYGSIAIGVLLMLVACFNFTNLATARALLRAREIALRKTVGARRRQLVVQFLGEAVLTALIGLAVALSIVEILLPAFDGFLQRPITFNYGADWSLLILILAIAVTAGLLSGMYPALIMSGFRPAAVLHSGSSGRSGSGRLRAILVVMQFAVSIGLGIAVLVIFEQISYARQINLGFRRDDIVVVSDSWRLTPSGEESFVKALRRNPDVLAAAPSSDVPFTNNQSIGVVEIPGEPGTVIVNQFIISPDFPRLYGIPIVAGRMLSDERSEDTFTFKPGGHPDPVYEGHNVVLNEAAVARFGFTPHQMTGKTILLNDSHVRVVGVLRDFKSRGVREPVKPTIYYYDRSAMYFISVRVRPQGLSDTLAFIDRTWHSMAPNTALQRFFLEDSFSQLYSSDERQGTMLSIFAGIAIVIACLGLFGLAAFTAGQRTREIGIRKAFGARTGDVTRMLLWHFSIPAVIANLIAWPIAGYYLYGWLQGFAYRIALSPLYFAIPGFSALVIAWMTVGIHALRVARANPINALRYE